MKLASAKSLVRKARTTEELLRDQIISKSPARGEKVRTIVWKKELMLSEAKPDARKYFHSLRTNGSAKVQGSSLERDTH